MRLLSAHCAHTTVAAPWPLLLRCLFCAQDPPYLLDSVCTLDGRSLLSLTEDQLRAFLAAVVVPDLQQCVQQLQLQGASCSASNGGNGGQQAPQQQQQQLAAALLGEYRRAQHVVCCRPKTLMLLTAGRMMTEMVHASAQQRLHSPRQQAAAAGLAAQLAQREMQMAEKYLAAAAVADYVATTTAAAAKNGQGKQQQQQQQGAGKAAAALSQNVVSTAANAAAGLHIVNSFLLSNQFHPGVGVRQLVADIPNRCSVAAAAAGATSGLAVGSTAAAVFSFALQGGKSASTASTQKGFGDGTTRAGSQGRILSSWLLLGPDLGLWRRFVELLAQVQQDRTKQPASKGQLGQRRVPCNDAQQAELQQASLQQCYTKAQQLLQGLQLQPEDLAVLQQQLNQSDPYQLVRSSSTTGSTVPGQQQQLQPGAAPPSALLLHQAAGQGVLIKPGWMHLRVSHVPNVSLCFEIVRPVDAPGCAVVQRQMPWCSNGAGKEQQQHAGRRVGPIVLQTLQHWYAYCQQQLRQRQQQQQQPDR